MNAGNSITGLQASSRHAEETIASLDAPLMDALVHSSRDGDSTTIVILEYSRNDEWFRRVLLTARELDESRRALSDAGLSAELLSGAKCFVAPELYEIAIQTLHERGFVLDKRHVIASADMENVVRQVIETGRKSVTRKEHGSFKMKSRAMVDIQIADPASSSSSPSSQVAPCSTVLVDAPVSLISRTFIHIPLPSSMRSLSSLRPASV